MSPDRAPEQQSLQPDQSVPLEVANDQDVVRPPLSPVLRLRIGIKLIENALRHPDGRSELVIDRQAGTVRIEPDPPLTSK